MSVISTEVFLLPFFFFNLRKKNSFCYQILPAIPVAVTALQQCRQWQWWQQQQQLCFMEKSTLRFKLSFFSYTSNVLIPPLTDYTSSILASGPYGLIFSSFVPFYFDIPVTARFHVFGFHFSNKSFIYLAGVQVKTYSGSNFLYWLKEWHYLLQQQM